MFEKLLVVLILFNSIKIYDLGYIEIIYGTYEA